MVPSHSEFFAEDGKFDPAAGDLNLVGHSGKSRINSIYYN
jgi:hypothetical protein